MQSYNITPVKYEEGKLFILDQTLLPGEENYIEINSTTELWNAIFSLKVRGAPAIGVAAAYGICLAVKNSEAADYEQFFVEFQKAATYLVSARPTAVNLSWALNRMGEKLKEMKPKETEPERKKECSFNHDRNRKEKAALQSLGNRQTWKEQLNVIKNELFIEAQAIRKEDEEACLAMGEFGLSLLKKGMGILTHCNAGGLATTGYGTCLAPIYLGQERGYSFKVFADETRPLLQGSRLTCWELKRAGVDVTLICDNMAATVMKKGLIDAVVVGCDRMAANGDGANKIGTCGVAILAAEYNIPFYMFAPLSTIDLETANGNEMIIEEREGKEIYEMWYQKPMAPVGVKTFNPAFDVTDYKYIAAVITERGVIYPPYEENLRKLFDQGEQQ